MNRTVHLKLHKVVQVPNSLRINPSVNDPVSTLSVDLGRLFHHYYFDSYESEPPDPDPTNFEYLKFLAATPEFRFSGKGPANNNKTGVRPAILQFDPRLYRRHQFDDQMLA